MIRCVVHLHSNRLQAGTHTHFLLLLAQSIVIVESNYEIHRPLYFMPSIWLSRSSGCYETMVPILIAVNMYVKERWWSPSIWYRISINMCIQFSIHFFPRFFFSCCCFFSSHCFVLFSSLVAVFLIFEGFDCMQVVSSNEQRNSSIQTPNTEQIAEVSIFLMILNLHIDLASYLPFMDVCISFSSKRNRECQ